MRAFSVPTTTAQKAQAGTTANQTVSVAAEKNECPEKQDTDENANTNFTIFIVFSAETTSAC